MKKRKSIWKRITAFLLAAAMLEMPVYANVQLPVEKAVIENVAYQLGQDLSTGERLIRPTILLSWTDPDAWATPTASGINSTDDKPQGYRVELKNLTLSGVQSYNVPYDDTKKKQESEISENITLKTGSLYHVTVRPYHFHTNAQGNQEPAQYVGPDPVTYAITDPAVDLESTDDSIAVIWDDLGQQDFKYRIMYALGDYSNEGYTARFRNNKEGEVQDLTMNSTGVERFFDKKAGRNRLKYILKENIYPGQVYSVLVEPTVDQYDSIQVVRNRNYPLIHSISTNIRLNYVEEGDKLRLLWKIPATFQVGKAKDKYTLTEGRLVEIKDGNERNLTIFYDQAAAINHYHVPKPKEDTSYQLRLTYKALSDTSKPPIAAVSNVLFYSPTELKITPTKPVIPNLLTVDQINEWKLNNNEDQMKTLLINKGYLLPSYNYAGEIGNIFKDKVVFFRDGKTNEVNLIWSAFRRKDIDVASSTYNKVITDLNTYYDIVVTDDYNALSSVPAIKENLRFEATAEQDIIKGADGEILGFRQTMTEYYDKQAGAVKKFQPNKIYYLQIIAKKKLGLEELKSAPSISSFYYDTKGIFAPPVMSKPPLRHLLERATKESAVIGWKEKWHEVIDTRQTSNPQLKEWLSVAWIKDGVVYPKEVEGGTRYDIYKGQTEADRFIAAAGNTDYHFVSREVDMGSDSYADSTIAYQFFAIPYQEVLREIETQKGAIPNPNYGFSEYFEDLIQKDKKGISPLNWKEITPVRNETDKEEWLHEEKQLEANTTYLFILNPYRKMKNGDSLFAHFPTPILVSTKPEADEVNPDPTVPRLYVVGATDTTISLAWTYNKDFTYKVKYRPVLGKGEEVEVPVEVSEDPLSPNYAKSGSFFVLKVSDLFPDTGYYFYIQAINATSKKESAWSNAVTGRTLPMQPPFPPAGFGIASATDIQRHNYSKPVDKDYVALQWMKLNEDTEINAADKVLGKNYEYILEIADNENFIDAMSINTSGDKNTQVEILEKTLVKVNKLVPGKNYYARVKTRMKVKGKDREISLDSDYTNIVRINTELDSGEYDGQKDPNLEILPDQNFELIYDKEEQSLTYRFRYQSKDAKKMADNRVDQRLINEIQKKKLYEYEADLSKYRNQTIKKRKIEIPYPVYEAFLKYQVDLKLLAGDSQFTFSMKAFEKEINRQKYGFGQNPTLYLELESDGKDFLQESAYQAVSPIQDLKAFVGSKNLMVPLSFADTPFKVSLLPASRSAVYQKTPVSYVRNAERKVRVLQGSYEKDTNLYSFETRDLGVYGLFTGKAKTSTAHWSDKEKNQLASKILLRNMNASPNQSIPALAFYQAIYAVVKGQNGVDLAESMTSEKKRILEQSGIMPKKMNLNAGLTRMQALTAAVNAYEMIQDDTASYEKRQVDSVAKLLGISKNEATILLKAKEVGLVSDAKQAQPKKTLSVGEFYAILNRMLP